MVRLWFGLKIAVFVALAVLLGVGIFTFIYARGGSYFSDDPKACTNCHIMNDVYHSWSRSSHQTVATCNACHVPHGFSSKWLSKARNGFNHSVAFTLQNFPEPIRITEINRQILQTNCIDCHSTIVSEIVHEANFERHCFDCHRGVGHGP
jgi:cytochrome c nitrite reductase small subunit